MTSPIDVVMCASADEFLLSQLESLCTSIENGNHSNTDIERVCRLLKVKGVDMELLFKDQLDTHFVTLRNASRDDRLDAFGRLMLLELIELRARRWQSDEDATEYYCRKYEELGFDPIVYDDAYAVKLAREFQQKQQQEQRSQMETLKAETKPAAAPILPWASQEIKNPENSANPQILSYQGPLKGEATFQNPSIWNKSPNLQDEQMHMRSGTSDMPAKATWQHFVKKEEVAQNANASTQCVSDGDAKTCVETITVRKDLIQISEPSNKPTVPGLHSDAVHTQGQTVGNSSFQKSQMDSSHGEAYEKDELRLVTEAVAWPLRDTLQSVGATKTRRLKMYSREFLLQCSQSSLATQVPPDFPVLDPEVANAMLKDVHHKVNN